LIISKRCVHKAKAAGKRSDSNVGSKSDSKRNGTRKKRSVGQSRTKFNAAAILNSIAGVIQALLVDMLKLM
jgi:hypothetical protein